MSINEGFAADAMDAEIELRAALTAAGITLPSLGLDPSSGSPPFVLVNLGGVRPETAMDLASAIRKGALAVLPGQRALPPEKPPRTRGPIH